MGQWLGRYTRHEHDYPQIVGERPELNVWECACGEVFILVTEHEYPGGSWFLGWREADHHDSITYEEDL